MHIIIYVIQTKYVYNSVVALHVYTPELIYAIFIVMVWRVHVWEGTRMNVYQSKGEE